MKENKYYSYNLGDLPRGCKLCITGEKTVLFVTGICPRQCFFCPLSPNKKNKDVIYANEMPISENDFKGLIDEAKSHGSKGAGITGGDPLSKINRTIKFIRLLKKEFGKKYHIHLYTSLNLATEDNLSKLYNAGLDEIRFHPDIDDQKWLERIAIAQKFKWDVGVEIPVFPDKLKQTKELIDKIYENIDFLNLNELEYSDNGEDFSAYKTISPETYAINGSKKVALEIMEHVNKKNITNSKNKNKITKSGKIVAVHFCTAKLKDAVQLRNRIRNKAERIKLPVDTITEDGLLIRGCIYLKENSPNNKGIKEIRNNSGKYFKKLTTEVNKIDKKEKYYFDEKNCRIIISPLQLERLKIKFGKKAAMFDFAVVEEYPTYDGFITSVDFI